MSRGKCYIGINIDGYLTEMDNILQEFYATESEGQRSGKGKGRENMCRGKGEEGERYALPNLGGRHRLGKYLTSRVDLGIFVDLLCPIILSCREMRLRPLGGMSLRHRTLTCLAVGVAAVPTVVCGGVVHRRWWGVCV